MERKAKLIKTDVNYLLENSEGVVIASTSLNKGGLKLSKQNCDEIFGVIDVEKLADEITKEYATLTPKAFKRGVVLGINKAIELNKDKVFTIDDMKKAFRAGFSQRNKAETNACKNLIQSLQQPTEIEVEIEVEPYVKYVSPSLHTVYPPLGAQPKLDSEGCLILKRVV